MDNKQFKFIHDYKVSGIIITDDEETSYYECKNDLYVRLGYITISDINPSNNLVLQRKQISFKKQKKSLKKTKQGGKNSLRFLRTQQSDNEYMKKIIEVLNTHVSKQVQILIIVGVGKYKNIIYNHDKLNISIKNRIKHVISTSSTDFKDVITLISSYVINIEDEKQIMSHINKTIQLNPDMLVFGANDIREKLELELIDTLFINEQSESLINDCNLNKVNIIKLRDPTLNVYGSIIGFLRFSVLIDYIKN